MKKVVSIVLLLTMLLALCACTKGGDPKEIAQSYVDKEIAGLFDKIGEPKESNYTHSCLGDGNDGELIYDGFTVYTYKEGDSEVVLDVY